MPTFILHHLTQALNLVPVNRPASHHHFETVVVLGVVAASDLYAAVAQGVSRKIKLWRGDHAHIDHFYTGVHQALYQRRCQRGPAQATITTHSHLGFTLRQSLGTESASQRLSDRRVKR